MNNLLKIKAMAQKGMAALTAMSTMLLTTTVSAAETSTENENAFMDVVDPIVGLVDSLFAPAVAIVVAVGTLYCVILGVKFAKAEAPQAHEKAKNRFFFLFNKYFDDLWY
jgi:hypothetical protein